MFFILNTSSFTSTDSNHVYNFTASVKAIPASTGGKDHITETSDTATGDIFRSFDAPLYGSIFRRFFNLSLGFLNGDDVN